MYVYDKSPQNDMINKNDFFKFNYRKYNVEKVRIRQWILEN